MMENDPSLSVPLATYGATTDPQDATPSDDPVESNGGGEEAAESHDTAVREVADGPTREVFLVEENIENEQTWDAPTPSPEFLHDNNDGEVSAGEGTTQAQTLVNFTKSSIGAASFALPWAMMNAGLILGSVGLVVISLTSLYTMNLMLECKNLIIQDHRNRDVEEDPGEPLLLSSSTETTTSRIRSYSNVASTIAPRWGRFVVEANVLMCNIGVCAGYLIFIGMNLQSAMQGLFKKTLTETECYGIILLIVIPLTWLSSFRLLSYAGFIGTVFMVVAMVFTYVSASTMVDTFDWSKVLWVKFDTFPFFFGVASFLFCVHSMVIPMEIQMANRQGMPTVLNWACGIVLAINLPFAIFGYVAFGDKDTAGYIFCNLPPSTFSQIIKLALSFELMCTYPLVLSPAIEILEELGFKGENVHSRSYFVATRSLRTVVVVLSLVLALLVPAFQLVLSLVGGLSASALAYVLPPLFHFLLMRSQGRPLKQLDYMHIALFLLGLGAVVLTTTMNIMSIVKMTEQGSIHDADKAHGVCNVATSN